MNKKKLPLDRAPDQTEQPRTSAALAVIVNAFADLYMNNSLCEQAATNCIVTAY